RPDRATRRILGRNLGAAVGRAGYPTEAVVLEQGLVPVGPEPPRHVPDGVVVVPGEASVPHDGARDPTSGIALVAHPRPVRALVRPGPGMGVSCPPVAIASTGRQGGELELVVVLVRERLSRAAPPAASVGVPPELAERDRPVTRRHRSHVALRVAVDRRL